MASNIAQNLESVKKRIAGACTKVGRQPSEVKLVVVTKTASFDQIRQVLDLGCRDLGENRVQQLKKISDDVADYLKTKSLNSPAVNWHMIGHLQRNKVKSILPIAGIIHSVDTLRLAEEISSASGKLGLKTRILLEVNTGEEEQKYGVPVGAATHLAEQIETLGNIQLCGLMTMAPLTDDKGAIRMCFARLRDLFIEMKGERIVGPNFQHLSMGMSNDFEIAIEEGATMVRVGSAIFANT